jgi:hypothetical protein
MGNDKAKQLDSPDALDIRQGFDSPEDGTSSHDQRQIKHDAVFGELNDEMGPNFRSVSGHTILASCLLTKQVGWIMSGILMIKTMLGLGVLSIPSVFDALGMIPGVICLLAIAAITTWCSLQIQDFKLRHPSIYGVDDAGFLMVGRVGREVLYVAYLLCTCHVQLVRASL